MAYDFQGSDDFIVYPNAGDGHGAQAFSVWLFVETDGDNDRFFVIRNTANNALRVLFQIMSDEALDVIIQRETNSKFKFSNASVIALTTWTHVAFTDDGTSEADNLHIYVSGSEVGYSNSRDSSLGGSFEAGGDFVFGGQGFGSTFEYDGRMCAPGWWNRQLSQNEITALAKGASPLFYPTGLEFAPELIRQTDDRISGGVGTITGTVTPVAEYGGIIRPALPLIGLAAGIAAAVSPSPRTGLWGPIGGPLGGPV